MLRRASLPCDCLEDLETIIPSRGAFRFREMVSEELGLKNVISNTNQVMEISDLGEFGRNLLKARTLYDLISRFCRFADTETSMAIIDLYRMNNNDVLFSHRFLYKIKSDILQSDLYILQFKIKAVQLVDPTWLPTEIWTVSQDTPTSRDAIEQMGAKNIHFNNKFTGIVVPSRMLALPIKENIGSSSQEEDLISIPAEDWTTPLEKIIDSYSSEHWLTASEASEVIGESKRTMQRRLAEEKATYSEILQNVRLKKAERLLETTDMRVMKIAILIGYSSEGNFSRAFHNWTGVSPRNFRLQRQAM